MQIDRAEIRDGGLWLSVPVSEIRAWLYRFKAGEYDLAPATKKRSLDANAFCWALICQIAAAVGVPKDTIYIDAIEAVGVYDALYIREDAFEEFARKWNTRGLGWFAQRADTKDGMILCLAYCGSSAYNTRQMAQLIDYLIDEAHVMGLDVTEDDHRIKSLLDDWERKQEA